MVFNLFFVKELQGKRIRHLLNIDGVDTRRERKLTAGTVQNVLPCTFCTYVFAEQTRYCVEPPPSVAVLIRRGFSVAARMPLVISEADAPDIFEPAPFEIDC